MRFDFKKKTGEYEILVGGNLGLKCKRVRECQSGPRSSNGRSQSRGQISLGHTQDCQLFHLHIQLISQDALKRAVFSDSKNIAHNLSAQRKK